MAGPERKTSLDRRSMLKKSAVAAGAAWAAPSVISTAAGAQNAECYFAKFDVGAGCVSSTGNGDPCAQKPAGALNGCGVVTASVDGRGYSLVLPAGCTLSYVDVKYATSCKRSSTLAYAHTEQQDISHINVYFCCDAGSVAPN